MQSTAASSSTETVNIPRNGLLLRVLKRFVKALQDARQREADRFLADYQQLTRRGPPATDDSLFLIKPVAASNPAPEDQFWLRRDFFKRR